MTPELHQSSTNTWYVHVTDGDTWVTAGPISIYELSFQPGREDATGTV